MAAWEHPDLFHRVLSFIGTFVDMKGADALPAMIRRTEPKPIRIYMQDGSNDLSLINGATAALQMTQHQFACDSIQITGESTTRRIETAAIVGDAHLDVVAAGDRRLQDLLDLIGNATTREGQLGDRLRGVLAADQLCDQVQFGIYTQE